MSKFLPSKSSFVHGTRLEKKDAQIIGESLQKLEETHGELTPYLVLDFARPKKSPLHSYFEWNDDKAAEKWRIEQARKFIAWVQIELIQGKPSRAFVNLESQNDEGGRFYVSIEKALSDPELRKQFLKEAYSDLVCWQDKYRTLRELNLVFSAIKKVKKKVIK